MDATTDPCGCGGPSPSGLGTKADTRRARFAHVAPVAPSANNVATSLAWHAPDCTADGGLILLSGRLRPAQPLPP